MSLQKQHEHVTAVIYLHTHLTKCHFSYLVFPKQCQTHGLGQPCSTGVRAGLSSAPVTPGAAGTAHQQQGLTLQTCAGCILAPRGPRVLCKRKPGYSKALSLKSRVILVLVKTYREGLKPDM